MKVQFLVIVFAITVCRKAKVCEAVVTVTFEGEFKSCDNGMELFGWDMSKLDILMMDNENITLNGKLEYTAEYKSPMTVKISLMRLLDKEGDSWKEEASRSFPNFCDVIGKEDEMWTNVVALMEKKTCPFAKGHTETFDNANVGNVAETLKVPTDMLGSWKAVIEVGSERDGVNVNECTMAPFLLEDV
ncbi:hypothetical protein quinque_010662 [Culex quinquefasciatus]|uniref:uncharacterized protein LOC6033257 n=1 Tax=Culex quinquefasciatus TaxID=7176 RepID=UPI0018E3EA38|nr:uncharacterized protein LOC6033257 [Culex quinquefasciatus]